MDIFTSWWSLVIYIILSPEDIPLLCCFIRIYLFISAWSMLSRLMAKPQQARTQKVPCIPCCTKLTPTVSVQSRYDFQRFHPITAKCSLGGRAPSRSREGYRDSWGEEACSARMILVALSYNLERCMQRTTSSPFQVEIQEELRPNLTGTAGEPGSGQVKFPAGCLQGHKIDPDAGQSSVSLRG